MNEIKKVCILGIDGLEYDFVEKYDLKNLKQVQYGKSRVIFEGQKKKIPYTPVIWSSFLSGKHPDEHKVNTDKVWKSRLPDIAAKIEKYFDRKLGIKLIPHKWINKNFARKLGFKYRPMRVDDLKHDTIFDFVGNSVALSVPCYSEKEETLELREIMVSEAQGKKTDLKEKAWKVYREKRKEFLDKLKNENWSLFMVHIYLVDALSHTYYYDQDYIKSLLVEMNNLA